MEQMDHGCYSFKLVCRPFKVHVIMLGTVEQTGRGLIHYTLLSVQIPLPEHNRGLLVCVWPDLCEAREGVDGNRAGV